MTDREDRVNKGLEARIKFNSLDLDWELETNRIREIVKKHFNEFVSSKNIFDITLESNEDFKLKYKKYFESLLNNDLKSYYYVWIGLSKGNVVVVGRASFSKNARSNFGDLFNKYNIFGGITQEILMKVIIYENENINLKDVESVNKLDKIKQLEQLNKELNNFFTHAIIIPVDVGAVNDQEAIHICSNVEKELGECLIKEKIKILNKDGHRDF